MNSHGNTEKELEIHCGVFSDEKEIYESSKDEDRM